MTKASQTARSRWGRYALLLATLAAFALLLGGMALPRSGRAATSTNFLRGTVTGSGFTTIKPTAIAIGPDGSVYVGEVTVSGDAGRGTFPDTYRSLQKFERVA